MFSLGVKVENGSVILTTHRIIFFTNDGAIEVPLCFVTKTGKTVS